MFELYTLGVISLLAAMSPGPDFFVVSKNAIGYSRKAGCLTTLGISSGILLHSLYCILGLTVIVAHSLLLFSIIRYIGASYLIYLGIKGLFTKNVAMKKIKHQKNHLSNWKAFFDGFLVNLLNPKFIVFILSIFTMVIKPNTAYWMQAVYAVELSIISTVWFFCLSFLLTHRKVKQRVNKIQTIALKIMGVVLIGFGLGMLFDSHH